MPDESVTSIMASHADGIFFPNIRELLKILAVLPIGSTEAERSFSSLRRLHTWLRSTMTTDSDLSVIAMHGNMMVALETDSIFGTPSKKDDVTITFWAVNILVGNVFMIAYCLGINVHGKLSLFFTKTSNNSNATRHQKLFTISTRN